MSPGGALRPGLRGLLRFARRSLGRRTAAVGSLTLATGAAEGVGLLLLVPLLSLAGLDLGSGGLTSLARSVGGVFEALGLRPTLPAVLVVFVAAATGAAALQAALAAASARLQAEATTVLRRRLYGAVTRARWGFLAGRRSSAVAHALTAEVDRVAAALHFLPALAAGAAVGAVYLAMAVGVAPGLTAATVACGGILLLAMRGRIAAARRSGEAVSAAVAAWYGEMQEHLASIRLHRAFGRADGGEERFGELAGRVAGGGTALTDAHAGTRFRFEVGTVAALAGLVYVSVAILALPAGSLVLLIFLYGRLMRRAADLQQQAQHLAGELPAWDAVARLEAECLAAAEPRAPAPAAPLPLLRSVELRDVSFRHAGEGPPALEGVTLSIPAARTTAVVGASGAGKSTLADLVAGILEPTAGCVRVDGEVLDAGRRAAWQAGLGMVPQDPFLFHDTVRRNLLWASPGASEADLAEALRAADAADLVARLPQGLDTVLGDRGATVSGGERQRLALARALLRRPPLLILDEATSSLDAASEERIRGALAALHGKATVLVISHRLSMVRSADAVHVLEGGRLVESGTFEELVARPGGRLRALAGAEGEGPAGP